MIPRPRTVILTFFGAIAWVIVAIWVVTTNSMLGDGGGDTAPVRRAVSDHVPGTPRVPHPDDGGSLLGTVWHVFETLTLIALVCVLVVLVVRRVGARRAGRVVRLQLLPHRDEVLDRRAVEDLLAASRELLHETPLRAALLGPPTLGLELATAPGRDGATVASLALVCPADRVPEIEGALHDRCPDTRLVREDDAEPAPVVLRLRRPRRGARSGGADRLPALLEAMAGTGAPVRIHYALVAARRPAGRRRGLADVGWLEAESGAAFEPTRTGPAAEPVGGGFAPGRPLPVAFHVEVRVAGPTRAACAAVAPAAAAGAGLLPANTLGSVRGGLTAPLRRRPRATTTSAELAGGWHLPGADDPGPRVPRTSVPRRPAPPRVSRTPEDALVRDERGPVGLAEPDRRAGLGIFGGSAQTRAALAGRWLARRAEGDEAVPVVVLAVAPGAAAAARAALDGHRDVRAIAPADLDVLAEPAGPDELGAAVADALLEDNAGDEARRVLGLTVAAAIAAGRAGALDEPPLPDGARRLLRPDETALRDGLARELYRRRGAADLGSFVGHELPVHLDGAAGAAAQAALDGPRARGLAPGIAGPSSLALADVMRRRSALVLDLASVPEEERGQVGRLALAGLGPALRAAAPPGHSASVRAALLIDGADAVVDAALADALARLGDAGLEVAATWRYAGVGDVALRLHRHRCLLGADPAADDLAAAEALCATVLDGDDRLTARGALTLPEAYMVCSWAPDGGARAAFVARAN